MTNDRWQQVKTLFQAAAERPVGERDAFLLAAARGDDALRREVESLLSSDTGGDDAVGFALIEEAPWAEWLARDTPSLPSGLAGGVLPEGARVGPYTIVSLLGSGAMGYVYRARDTKLHRDVGLKLLSGSLALDPERLARFRREARLLATLNHPNIGAIYGLEDADGAVALILELVEGETLRHRLARGPLSPAAALPIARQIAEALEAAHAQGIVHRDLKPANVQIRADGTVKVLDFGVAKAIARADTPAGDSEPPWSALSDPASTRPGLLVGTVPYMSPEQAAGRTIDPRTDIWAFGAIVFEMLTGRPPFAAETAPEVLAAILKTQPDWSALPGDAPVSLRRLLRWCLEKDPKRRLQAIGDARVLIDDLLSGGADETPLAPARPASAPRRAGGNGILVVVSGAALAAALGTWLLTRPAPVKAQPVRFAIVTPAAQPLVGIGLSDVAVSPDGRHFAYVAGPASNSRLMLRAIDQIDAVPVGDITGASSPFFSPDGRWIGFFTGNIGGELRKVSIAGGPPVSLGRTRGLSGGASWGPDDAIVFGTFPKVPGVGLLRVPAAGGALTALTQPEGEANHLFPFVLPGGRAVLFTIVAGDTIGDAERPAQVALLDLETGRSKTLIPSGSQAAYIDASTSARPTGYLVYLDAHSLRAVRFDPAKLEILGDPVPVVDYVQDFSVSGQGALVYVPRARAMTPLQLVWVDRKGRETTIPAPPHVYLMPRLSPDGQQVAVSIAEREVHTWIWDFARGTLTRLTDRPGSDWYAAWTPDGKRIVFGCENAETPGFGFCSQAADHTGATQRLTTVPGRSGVASISPDGTRLIVMVNEPATGWDLELLRLDGPAARVGAASSSPLARGGDAPTPAPLVHTAATEMLGEISPDGHWLAYQSDESGQNEIWVRPFPDVDAGHWQVSSNGGIAPVWARTGKELFYLDGTNALTRVPIQTTPPFSAGRPEKLFDARYYGSPYWRTFDVSPDGQRFLMIKRADAATGSSTPTSMVVVLNWSEELKARLPPR